MRTIQENSDLIGSRVALFSILNELSPAYEKIIALKTKPGSRMHELKFCIFSLECSKRVKFSKEWIYQRLYTLLQLLSNPAVKEQLSTAIDVPFIQNLIQHAYLGFYPYISHSHSLEEIEPARADDNAIFLNDRINESDTKNDVESRILFEEDIYSKVIKLLERTKGRDDYYRSKAPNNPAKRTSFRLLDYVATMRFPQEAVFGAVRMLLITSEIDSDARKDFAHLIPAKIDMKLPPIKQISDTKDPCLDHEVAKVLQTFDELSLSPAKINLLKFRFESLYKIVCYDSHLEGGEKLLGGKTSFDAYQSMGKKNLEKPNVEKQFAARDLFYTVISEASMTETLTAMSRFVFYTKNGSVGEKLFKPFYFETCVKYFNSNLKIEVSRNEPWLSIKEAPISEENAYWVLFASVHSVMLLNKKLFQKTLVRGKANTLNDIILENDPVKRTKSALLELQISLQQGSDLQQLFRIVHALHASTKDEYPEVTNLIEEIYQSFKKNYEPWKSLLPKEIAPVDVVEPPKEKPAIRKEKEALLKEKKTEPNLKLRLANYELKKKYLGEGRESYMAKFQVLNEFGGKIEERAPNLHKALLSTFKVESETYCIDATQANRVMFVPACMKYESKGNYSLKEITVQLEIKEPATLLDKLIRNFPPSGRIPPVEISSETLNGGYRITALTSGSELFSISMREVSGSVQVTLTSNMQKIIGVDPVEILNSIHCAYVQAGGKDKLIAQAADFLRVIKGAGKAENVSLSRNSVSKPRAASFGNFISGLAAPLRRGSKAEASPPPALEARNTSGLLNSSGIFSTSVTPEPGASVDKKEPAAQPAPLVAPPPLSPPSWLSKPHAVAPASAAVVEEEDDEEESSNSFEN